MAYLLDTNHCSYIINGLHRKPVYRKTQEIKAVTAFESLKQPAYTCDVVAGEMFYGAEISNNPQETYRRIEVFLKTVAPLVADKESWMLFAATKAELTRNGKVITDFDLLIASIAHRHGYTLVTNDSAFKHLPSAFKVENWVG